jgi:hypothetical protein
LATPITRFEPAPPSRPSDPDAAALPALEAFLAAVLRAKASLRERHSPGR